MEENGAATFPPSQIPLSLVLMKLEDFPPSKCLYILTLMPCQLHSQISLTSDSVNKNCFLNGEAVFGDYRVCIITFSSSGAFRC